MSEAQTKSWQLALTMRDEEGREITAFVVLADFDAHRLAVDTVISRAATKLVDDILREHRKASVGEE